MISENVDEVVPAFTLIIADTIRDPSGIYARLNNEVFHDTTMDCWIDNTLQTCWITGFYAKTEADKILCIRYFCSNLFNRLLELNGYVGIHSSCVNCNGIGIAFIGERMAGKTTCMLSLIDAGFDLICNDVSAMRYIPKKKIVEAYGVPNDAFIRMSADFCTQRYVYKYLPIAQIQGINCDKATCLTENRIMLTHKTLAELNRVLLLPATKVDLVIIPKYTSALKKATFTKLNRESCVQHFLSQETELIHDSTMFLGELNLQGSIHGTLSELAVHLSQLPCYYCEYNEKTTQDFVASIRLLCGELKRQKGDYS